MRRNPDAYCKCQHYQCDHIEEKKLPNGKKTRMGCMVCSCGCFVEENSSKPLIRIAATNS